MLMRRGQAPGAPGGGPTSMSREGPPRSGGARDGAAYLLRLHEGSPDALALFRRLQPTQVVPSARALIELLANRTRALAHVALHSRVRLTVTSTLHHAVPSLPLSDITDLFRFDGWAVRSLHALRR